MSTLQIFLDETYPATSGAELIAIAGVGAFKSQWRRFAADLERVAGVRTSRKLATVRSFVEERRIRAVIAGARLDRLGAAPGVVDSFSDLPEISRRDNVWSQVMGYGASLVLRRALESGWKVGVAEIFYDSKTLAFEHRQVVHKLLARVVSDQATRLTRRRSEIRSQQVLVRRVGPVSKPKSGCQSTPLQWGTWLAHWVGRLPDAYAGDTMPANVEVYDVEEFVGLSPSGPTLICGSSC